jgi:hypothetical protein
LPVAAHALGRQPGFSGSPAAGEIVLANTGTHAAEDFVAG